MWVAAILVVAATALQMYMQYQQGQAESRAAKQNAKVLGMQAGQAQAAGTERAERMRRLSQHRLSEIRAGYAKAGVTPEGTPLLVEAEAAKELELEALTEKWKGDVEAVNYRNQSAMEKWRARMIKVETRNKMISTGVSGLSSAYGAYGASTSTATTGSTGKSLLSGSGSYGIA